MLSYYLYIERLGFHTLTIRPSLILHRREILYDVRSCGTCTYSLPVPQFTLVCLSKESFSFSADTKKAETPRTVGLKTEDEITYATTSLSSANNKHSRLETVTIVVKIAWLY